MIDSAKSSEDYREIITGGLWATICLSKNDIAYLQMPCNILPVLPQQLGQKFGSAVKKVKAHHFNKLGTPYNVSDAIYQDSASKLSWLWRKRFLSVFFLLYLGMATTLFDGTELLNKLTKSL